MELVREIIAAAPDWHEVSALLHPDARFDQSRIPQGGVYEGREACGRFFERWFGTWDEIRLTPERFIEDGDRVLALMTIEGRGSRSGNASRPGSVGQEPCEAGRECQIPGWGSFGADEDSGGSGIPQP